MERYDFLIVGAGFTGCVMAERLNSAGEKVLVIEKKGHIGGLCHDFHDNSKVLVHKYGPHYFRTNSDRVISYLSKFTEWHFHDYIAKTFVNGKILPFPINRTTINRFFNINLKTDEEVLKFLESKREKIPNPRNAEEQIIAAAGKEIYEAFFKNYTIKKWDVDPKKLDPNVTGRIPIRAKDDDRFFTENSRQCLRKDIPKCLKTC